MIASCGPSRPTFQNADVTGANWARDFSLIDQKGRPRNLADFRGKAVVLFFGYVHCPDVCPTALAQLKSVVRQLGDDGKRVQVLFVTVDSERDTPEVLTRYVTAFDPGFLGLYGDPENTARVTREFKVFYQKVAGSRPENYSVDHTAAIYVFDPRGRLRVLASQGRAETLAADIRILLSGG